VIDQLSHQRGIRAAVDFFLSTLQLPWSLPILREQFAFLAWLSSLLESVLPFGESLQVLPRSCYFILAHLESGLRPHSGLPADLLGVCATDRSDGDLGLAIMSYIFASSARSPFRGGAVLHKHILSMGPVRNPRPPQASHQFDNRPPPDHPQSTELAPGWAAPELWVDAERHDLAQPSRHHEMKFPACTETAGNTNAMDQISVELVIAQRLHLVDISD